MYSSATSWQRGRRLWSVEHDAQKALEDLDVQGDPPQEFAAIRDELFAKQTDESCDYIFDIPVELARTVTGYRHDRNIGLPKDAFEVLVRTHPFG